MIDKVAALVIHEGKILLVREAGEEWWLTPGGKREAGETDLQTLERELEEELGVRPTVWTYFDTFRGQTVKGDELKITCFLCELGGTPKPASEIEELSWMNSSEIEAQKGLTPIFREQIVPKLVAAGLL
jgi:8-oxo-dGTP pyrophosphatase MutT (NUDIX family)